MRRLVLHDFGQDQAGALALRIFEESSRYILFSNQLLVEDNHVIRHLVCEIHRRCHRNNVGSAWGKCAHDIQHFLDHLWIMCGSRLVELYDFGLHGQRVYIRHVRRPCAPKLVWTLDAL